MNGLRIHRRTLLASFALAVASSPDAEAQDSNVIQTFRDFQLYLDNAIAVVRDLTARVHSVAAHGSLAADERAALESIRTSFVGAGVTPGVFGAQSHAIDRLENYAMLVRTGGASEGELARNWQAALQQVQATSTALADAVRAARNTPAFADALRDAQIYNQFFNLAGQRGQIMARIINMPRPRTSDEIAALDATTNRWASLLSMSRGLLNEISTALQHA